MPIHCLIRVRSPECPYIYFTTDVSDLPIAEELRKSFSIFVNSFNRTGFVRYKSTPEENASCCALALPSPVSAMMNAGWTPCCCSNALISRVASKPSITGMLMSMSMTCGFSDGSSEVSMLCLRENGPLVA